MKYIIFFFILTGILNASFAQKKTFRVATGMSVFNSKLISLHFETRIKSKNYFGIFAETFFYADRTWPLNLHSDEKHYYAGLYYKPLIGSSRNFSHHVLIGGVVGTSGKKFLYYPFAGLEQDFYIAPKSIFFIGEELKYLFPLKNKWQPFIKTGLKFSLQ
ncbi:MAG TPA: hypothetical protein DCQ50_01520 [Chryseobacterium sp.]|nr:hypothetical protein [Chryseobacterium sp.]